MDWSNTSTKIAASMIVGVFPLEIHVFGGYDFVEPICTVGSMDISVGLIVAVGSMVWVVATTSATDRTEHEPVELAAILIATTDVF